MENEVTGVSTIAESANESSTDNQEVDNAAESANESSTDNQEGTTQKQEQVSNAPKPYSYEEMQNVKNYTELDPARLPKSLADAVNASKASQAELTRAQQRLSAQERAQPQPQRPADPKQAFAFDVFRAFDNGDYGQTTALMNSLTNSIERRKLEYPDLVLTDPDKAAQMKQSLLEDMDFKGRLDGAIAKSYQDKTMSSSLYNDVDAEIFKAMPNFKEIAPEIGNFATKELHFDRNTIEDTMDARIYIKGLMDKYGISQQEASTRAKAYVVQLTKGIHDLYMRISGKGLKGKEYRNPPHTESGGQRSNTNSNDLKTLRAKASKTGDIEDWAKVYSEEAKLEKSTRR